jgi:hypothetical protein
MASVEVFVDDAVRGRLPNVCVKTGEKADGKLRIEQDCGGLGGGWFVLLLLFGPFGWIVLAILSATARGSVLTVRLPYSEAAVDREVRLSRERWVAVAVAVLLGLAAIARLASIPRTVWWVGAVVALVVAAIVHVRFVFTRVHIRLDASGRWITLSNVHPEFVRAVIATGDADRSEAFASD